MIEASHTPAESTVPDAIFCAMRRVAGLLRLAATVTYTSSGYSSLRAARERPAAPIVSLTPDIRTALGVPTFYNEALGSVSQVSVYDRVKGRVGDVPDETVGAHSPGSGH